MLVPPAIRYYIPHRGPSRSPTQFQLFTREWQYLTPLIERILTCPTTFVDIVGSATDRIELRVTGVARHSIAIVKPEWLLDGTAPAFPVIVTPTEADEVGRRYRKSHPQALHLPATPLPDEVGVFDATSATFVEWLMRVMAGIEETEPDVVAVIRSFPKKKDQSSPIPAATLSSSLLTFPNDMVVLASEVVAYKDDQDPVLDVDQAIRRSYGQVRAIRDAYAVPENYPPGNTEWLLAAPGMARDLPVVIPRSHELSRDIALARLWRDLRQNDTFLLPTPEVPQDSGSLASQLFKEREGELELAMLYTALEAVGQFLPVVPLVRTLAPARRRLARFLDAVRNRPKGWEAMIPELARNAGAELAAVLPDYVLDELVRLRGTVKVFSDDPLELVAVADRPLNALHPVVRVPVSPGSLLEDQFQLRTPTILQPRDFSEILVLRGTARSDPMYAYLETFVRVMMDSRDTVVTIRDVASFVELRSTVESFRGAMMVFDGHGFHGARSMGKLYLGNESVDAGQLATIRRCPPIVFLAACETHAPDRFLPTTALALLNAGASTVIGTIAPVGAVESGVLVSQLLTWIAYLTPTFPSAIRFSELYWLAAANAHVGEGLLTLRRLGLLPLSPEEIEDLTSIVARGALARFEADWLQQVWQEIHQRHGISREEVRALWNRYAYVTDSLMHCQIGQPDMLFVGPTDAWADGL